MARWLVSCGARYLILLTRSSPRTTEAQELLSEVTAKVVRVEAHTCDISDKAALRSVLDDCARKMLPIKGCIQSTMFTTVRSRSKQLNNVNSINRFLGARLRQDAIS